MSIQDSLLSLLLDTSMQRSLASQFSRSSTQIGRGVIMSAPDSVSAMGSAWRFVLHGGCTESCPDTGRQKEISAKLRAIGWTVSEALANGLSAKEVVVLAVSALEDCPLFNVGHGAALTRDGRHQVCQSSKLKYMTTAIEIFC